MARSRTTPEQSPADASTRTSGPAIRLAAAIVALVVGLTAVACSSPNSSENGSSAEVTTTSSIIDPGNGPTSISQTIRTDEIASGFDQPTAMINRPMRNQLWVAERPGRVRIITVDTEWNLETGLTVRGGYDTAPFPVIDISGDVSTQGERGLLGIAFSTDAKTLFLDYVNTKGEIVVASWNVTDPAPPPPTTLPPAPAAPSTLPGQTTTTRRTASTTTTTIPQTLPPPIVDLASRKVLLTIPRSDGNIDNGGQLALGRDGYLYIGVGDAGKAGDPKANAQNPESLLGKILRIDPALPNINGPYAIPPTNPFANGGGAPQVWMLGVRNPLRFSFDRANGDLWIGDPGENKFEEIDWLPASSGAGRGANLGWPWKEGTSSLVDTDVPKGLVDPVLVYNNVEGRTCSVVGGYVYRGSAMPGLQGVYLYSDYCSGSIRGLLQRKRQVLDDKAIGASLPPNQLVAFGQDDQGELYVVSSAGSISKLVAG